MRFLLFKLAQRCTCLSLLCSFLFIGCGKAVNTLDDETDPNNQFLLPGSVVVEATKLKDIYSPSETPIPSELRSIDGEYIFPKLAQVTLPESIYVSEGNAGDELAYVFINEHENEYDFYCVYSGGASTNQPTPNTEEALLGMSYNFKECYDSEGSELGLDPGAQVWVDKGNAVEVHVEGADPRYDTKTITTMDVDWI